MADPKAVPTATDLTKFGQKPAPVQTRPVSFTLGIRPAAPKK